MSSSEYQVTIKSANQKVDDFVTTCRSNWTVHQLKQHISGTHINKPSVQDQRLIYAGNILKDSQNLKQIFFRDSLCTEFSNSNKDFTIHLVCATPKIAVKPATTHGQTRSVPQATSSQASLNSSTSTPTAPIINSAQQQTTNDTARPNQQAPTIINAPTTSRPNPSSLGPQLTTPTLSATQQSEIQNLLQSDQMRQQMAVFQQLACMVAAQIAHTVANNDPNLSNVAREQVNMIPNFIPPVGAPSLSVRLSTTSPFSSHLTASQLLYAENRQQTQYVPTDARGSAVHQNENVNNEHNVGNQPAAPFGYGAQMQAAAPAPVVEQPVPRPDQEIHLQHDLIDWVYYSIRAAVFMAALYIHASMFRLLFIVSLLAIAYFFNRRSARRATPAGQEPRQELQGAAAAAPPLLQNAQINADLRRRNIDHGVQPVAVDNNRNNNNHNNNNNNAGGEAGGGNQNQEVAAAPAHLPFLKLCYLVVTDFLASLVPE